ncbi:MAG: glycoside hydrolase family 3 C-terminal domain-containing protein [Oscillospiraceae bacterium]|nr:glycoside hydrolase family 3 C-terminal domain-containing protein [Oscillospiraceae bacterium]
MKIKKSIALVMAAVMVMGLCGAFASAADAKYTVTEPNDQGIIYVYNEGGKTLGYSKDSGVTLLENDGFAFKDLNKNGVLDTYEDWRLADDVRAEALANMMVADGRTGIEAISGLMLYSSHTAVSSENIAAATNTALTKEHLRHVLVTNIASPEVAAKWSNNVQAFAESVEYGIPANNSSDPRHSVSSSNVEYEIGSTGALSQWPASIGLAATFNEGLVKEAGKIVSKEYRALGITTSLGPQIDTSSDPRWTRVNGTFGEDEALSTNLTRAYVDGYQTTYDAEGNPIGWGADSINAMVKHWPGGGAGEGGRDAHYNYGKFSVFPADNLASHMAVFTEGAFKLEDGTGSATAVMPYYTISYDQDPTGGNVGNSYSRFFITDQLRGKYDFKGVVCTDWNIVYDVSSPYSFGGMCWGMENVDITDRFIRLISTGVDQFGGVNEIANIMFAYDKSVEDNGLTVTNQMWANSGKRLLTNIFQTGLFENPYLDPAKTAEIVGNSDFMSLGYDAQLKSVVMLKNSGIISDKGITGKVYAANANNLNDNSAKALFQSYFGDNYAESVEDASAMFIVINAPSGGGYDSGDFNRGGNGYVPMTLQYSSYTATTAREHSIASNPNVYWERYGYDVENRSYKDKTYVNRSNVNALNNFNSLIEQAKAKEIPVIVYVRASNPMVFSEIEPSADAILVGYNITTQAALDIATGKVEPSGMLPMQQPANMEAVEAQFEDAGHDMECYVDAAGNKYDFGFGLNYKGVIGVDSEDARYEKYVLSGEATATTIKGGSTTGKCGEGETATFDVTYDSRIDASTVRVQLNTDLKMLKVTSDFDMEYNPANGKVIIYSPIDGIKDGDVLFTVTYDLNVSPWLPNGQKLVPIKLLQATDMDNEEIKGIGTPGAIIIANEYKPGDVNLDGTFNNIDLILIARYLVELVEFNDYQKQVADYNNDGVISNKDLVLIARALVEA